LAIMCPACRRCPGGLPLMGPRRGTPLFDYLVGAAEDCRGKREPERLGGLQIDDELNDRRPVNRQVTGFRAIEDPAGVIAGAAIEGGEAVAIGHQTATCGVVAPGVDCRHLYRAASATIFRCWDRKKGSPATSRATTPACAISENALSKSASLRASA